MPTFVTEEHVLYCHTCQICYSLEIKLLLQLLLLLHVLLQILVGLLYNRWEICAFISSSFLLLPIFSLFSNNKTRRDLPNRQSINQSINQPINQSINLRQINQSTNQSVSRQSVSQSVNQYRTLGKHGVYHHIS